MNIIPFIKKYRTINKNKQKEKVKRINFSKLKQDKQYKTNFNWHINLDNLENIQDSLISRNVPLHLKIAIFSQVIPESGGETGSHSNGAEGFIGYRGDRKADLFKNTTRGDVSSNIHYLLQGIFNNPESKYWSHGGRGTNINTGNALDLFKFF